MSDSWRIQTILNDTSSVVQSNVGSVGATVIKASRGPVVPVKINKGQTSRILDIFGPVSASYPGVWEAIQYAKKYPLWLAAPSTDGLYGGVMVTSAGTKTLHSGVSAIDSANFDFAAVPITETLGTGDGTTTNFTLTIAEDTIYVHQSLDILVNGTSITVSASDAEPEVLTSTDGSGTYTRATGVVDFTFDTAPASGASIQVSYDADYSATAYMAFFSRDPQADYMSTMITQNDDDTFTVHLYKKSGSTYTEIQGSPFTVSTVTGAKDGFGKIIYAEDLFDGSDYVNTLVNSALPVASFTDDTTKVDFAGGVRGTTSSSEYTSSWNYFQQSRTYPADVFFDTTADSGIPDLFVTLRSTYQKYSAYLLPLPNDTLSNNITTKTGYSISDRGIYFYWNWFKVKDSDTTSSATFWTNLLGKVATKHADMYVVYNGLAPAWIDENGLGGQLSGGVLEAAYDPSESDLKLADTNQINPIILDPQYGVMITSDRTSLTSLSDYSYIPHSRTADWILKTIISQVLPYQLVKLNDNAHQTRVRTKAETILAPLVSPPYNLLEDFAVKCDDENNDATVKSLRQFVLSVAVKCTPTSEEIKFIFTNTEQGANVQEAV